MSELVYCVARKSYVNTDNMTARFDVKGIQKKSLWISLSNEIAFNSFPHKGMVFRSLKKDSPSFISMLNRNDFFVIECGENARYDSQDFRLDRYYAQDIYPIAPIMIAPQRWKNSFEIARQNLHQLPTRKEDTAFLFFNDSYFKLIKREFVNDQNQKTAFYDFDVQPNDKATVIPYDIPADRRIPVSGEMYCLEQDAVARTEYYFSGKDSQFVRLIVNRFKNFSLEQGEFQKAYGALDKLKQLSSFFDAHLSKYDRPSLEERITFLQDELWLEDSLKTCVLKSIAESEAFNRKLDKFERGQREGIISNLNEYRIDQQKLIDDELKGLNEKRAQLSKQVDSLHAQKLQLEKVIATEKEQVAAAKKTLGNELSAIKKALINCSYAEIPYAQAFAERMNSILDNQQVEFFPSPVAPWQNPPRAECEEERPEKEIIPHLGTIADVTGHNSEVLMHLDGFSRAGELPFLYGQGSQSHLQQYANMISGGRLYRMQADPSTLSLDDLWRTPSSQLPTAFAIAWNAAREEDQYHIVQINIEESPCHLWLKGLFDVMHSALRPRTLLVVLTGSHFLAHIDSNLWNSWVIPIDCPVAGLPVAHAEFSTVTPNLSSLSEADVQQDFSRIEDLLRFKSLLQASPHLAKLYPLWPQEIPESSWLQLSKLNFPY